MFRPRVTAGAWVCVAWLCACTRVIPGYTDDSTDDGGTTLGPYDPSSTTIGDGDGDGDPTTTTEGPPDLPPDPPNQPCDRQSGQTDCGPGQKCVPIVSTAYECVEILGDKQPGDACVYEPVGNLDDCGADSYCFLDRCQPFCDLDAQCSDPQRHCILWDESPSWLCIDQCNPVTQDCPAPDACEWFHEVYGFQCMPGGGSGFGEPCEFFGSGDCAAGFECIDSQLFAGGCPMSGQCCTAFCDVELGDQACVNGPPGSVCLGLELELAPSVGLCAAGAAVEPGQIQIVEVYSDPPGVTVNEPPHEYVELINLGVTAVDLGALRLRDLISSEEPQISERFTPSGDGGCLNGGPYCLGPGRRALLVGSTYIDGVGGALLLRASNTNIVNGLLQPHTRLALTSPENVVISSYRVWPDPGGDPLPMVEQPMHRVDPQGADTPDNWVEAAPTPGL